MDQSSLADDQGGQRHYGSRLRQNGTIRSNHDNGTLSQNGSQQVDDRDGILGHNNRQSGEHDVNGRPSRNVRNGSLDVHYRDARNGGHASRVETIEHERENQEEESVNEGNPKHLKKPRQSIEALPDVLIALEAALQDEIREKGREHVNPHSLLSRLAGVAAPEDSGQSGTGKTIH